MCNFLTPAAQMERVATSPPPPGGVAVTMSPPPPSAAPAPHLGSDSDDDALPPPESFEVTTGLRIAERERSGGGGGRARWWRCAAAARPAREASVSRRMEALFGETERENMLHVRLRGMASLAIGLLIIASVKVRSLCTRARAPTLWREVLGCAFSARACVSTLQCEFDNVCLVARVRVFEGLLLV